MVKFRRIMIFTRLLLICFWASLLYDSILTLKYFSIDSRLFELSYGFLIAELFWFLIFALALKRNIKLLFTTCLDIELKLNEILIKNIITRKRKTYAFPEIYGYRIENYYWQFFNVPIFKSLLSFFSFRGKKVVLCSYFSIKYHLKVINYGGVARLSKLLNESEIYRVRATQNFIE